MRQHSHWPGVVLAGAYNALMLAGRDLRDVFQPELWAVRGHVHAHVHVHGSQPELWAVRARVLRAGHLS